MLGTQAPYFYRFKLGTAEATIVSDGPLPLGDPNAAFLGLDQGRDRAPARQQFPAARERRARAERADRQHRRPHGAVRHRHGQREGLRADHRQADEQHQAGRHRPEGHRRRGDEPRAISITSAATSATTASATSRTRSSTSSSRTSILDRREAGRRPLKSSSPRRRRTCCRSATASSSSRTARNSCPASRRSVRPATRSATRSSNPVRRQVDGLHRRPHPSPGAADGEAADRVRLRHRSEAVGADARAALNMLAAKKTPLVAYHFAWPGIGHVAKQGDGFRYYPEPMNMAL